MIHTFAVTSELELLCDPPLKRLFTKDIQWYWVDFQSPTEEETLVLRDCFNFHYLAIEDCLNFLQRPKLDYYGDYNFFVLHVMNQQTLKAEEINVFLNHNFICFFSFETHFRGRGSAQKTYK